MGTAIAKNDIVTSRKLSGQGNVFTGVCLSMGKGLAASGPRGGGGCLPLGLGVGINKRAVHILLW